MTEKTYAIEVEQRAAKFLRKLAQGDKASVKRIADAIRALGAEPRPAGYEPVKSRPGHLRVRAGDYRIVYRVDDGTLTVLVVQVGHRSDVYE